MPDFITSVDCTSAVTPNGPLFSDPRQSGRAPADAVIDAPLVGSEPAPLANKPTLPVEFPAVGLGKTTGDVELYEDGTVAINGKRYAFGSGKWFVLSWVEAEAVGLPAFSLDRALKKAAAGSRTQSLLLGKQEPATVDLGAFAEARQGIVNAPLPAAL